MRCMPGASHMVIGPLVKSPEGYAICCTFLAVVALAIVIALPIGAAAQAGFGEQALVNLALLAQCDVGFEAVNLRAPGLRASCPRVDLSKVNSKFS